MPIDPTPLSKFRQALKSAKDGTPLPVPEIDPAPSSPEIEKKETFRQWLALAIEKQTKLTADAAAEMMKANCSYSLRHHLCETRLTLLKRVAEKYDEDT